MKNKKMLSWINPKLEVRKVKKYGKGVFAKDDIKKGETLAIFGGYILTLKEEEKLAEKYRDGGLQIGEDYVISSKDHFEPTDFFNHSCEPNAGFKGQTFLVSMKKISKNDEVSFDYAMCLFSKTKEDDYILSCECGSKKCRKNITSNDWRIKELQIKYSGYFQKFLEDKLN